MPSITTLAPHHRHPRWPLALPVELPPGADQPFTAAQAAAAGATSRGLRALVDAGVLVRVIRGVYVSAAADDTIELRARALSLVMPRGCFVSDRCAAWLHGAPRALAPGEEGLPAPATWCRPLHRCRIGRPPGNGDERLLGPGDLTEVHGVVVTTPLRTACDLALRQPRDIALAGLDALSRLGLVTRQQIMDEVERFRGRRGVRQLRELAAIVDPGSDGYAESALRLRWYDAGLPEPRTRIPVPCASGVGVAHLDLGLEHHGVAAVCDRRDQLSDPDHERRRLEWIREQTGFRVEVLDRRCVFDSPAVAVERLARAFGPVVHGRPREAGR